jgi:hypothetical protein
MSTPDRVIVGLTRLPYVQPVRRLPHGATHRPGSDRPANGYGRRPGRPGPDPRARLVARLYRDWWTGTEAVVDLIGTPMSSVGPAELLDPTV